MKMNAEKLEYIDGHLLMITRRERFEEETDDVTKIYDCGMADEVHQSDDRFYILLFTSHFWLVGPSVAGSLAAIQSLLSKHPSIPVHDTVVSALPRKFREPGLFGLRAFQTPGFSKFPLSELENLEILVKSAGEDQ
jgi:hypothetical protein